jgi:hypothetical protein
VKVPAFFSIASFRHQSAFSLHAGFLNLLPLLRLVLTIHVASPILILQHLVHIRLG